MLRLVVLGLTTMAIILEISFGLKMEVLKMHINGILTMEKKQITMFLPKLTLN